MCLITYTLLANSNIPSPRSEISSNPPSKNLIPRTIEPCETGYHAWELHVDRMAINFFYRLLHGGMPTRENEDKRMMKFCERCENRRRVVVSFTWKEGKEDMEEVLGRPVELDEERKGGRGKGLGKGKGKETREMKGGGKGVEETAQEEAGKSVERTE